MFAPKRRKHPVISTKDRPDGQVPDLFHPACFALAAFIFYQKVFFIFLTLYFAYGNITPWLF